MREPVVRTVLGLTGLVALFTGANVGFGGIETLGLEGPADFVEIADPAAFAVHDNHVRYLGGLWFGMGLLFLAASIRLDRLRVPVMTALALMFVGGVSRLSAGDLSVFVSSLAGPSFAAEIVVMPLLLWRVWLGGRAPAGAQG